MRNLKEFISILQDNRYVQQYLHRQRRETGVMQYIEPWFEFKLWLLGFVILIIFSVTITWLIRTTPIFTAEGRKGIIADWWRWINTPSSPDYKRRVYTPSQTIQKQVVSWVCPICGSDLNPDDVEQIELGYNIECKYCGATLGSR